MRATVSEKGVFWELVGLFSDDCRMERINMYRDALQLEEMLRSMEQAEISAFKHAASLASGQSDDSEAALAELRALRHASTT